MTDPDGIARIAYLALLGMVLIGGLFAAYRGRMGRALRDAAIWLLIILGFVTLYGFKDTLLGELRPSAAVLTDEGIQLRRGSDGHFHATLEINGAPVRFIVDTGASSVVLTREDARRVGLDPGRLDYTRIANTANGTVRGAPVTLDEVRFGGTVERNLRAVVNGGDLFSSLLGMDYLDRFRRITVEGDTLTLAR